MAKKAAKQLKKSAGELERAAEHLRKAAKQDKKRNYTKAARQANAARVKVHTAENGASRALKQEPVENGKSYIKAEGDDII
jgi:hypothetical protein